MQIFGSAFKGLAEKCEDIIVNSDLNKIIIISKKEVDFSSAAETLKKNLQNFEIINIRPEQSHELKFFGIILEGTSIKTGIIASEKFGLKSFNLSEYDLSNLQRSQKTMFGYALKGRKAGEGLLRNLKGEVVGRNAVIVPSEKIGSLNEFMAYWNVQFKSRKIFLHNEKLTKKTKE